MAVALLIEALREEDLLLQGLQAMDRNKETPLHVAQSLQKNQLEERQSVARWDVVAGGSSADWDKVVELLVQAEKEVDAKGHDSKLISSNLPRHNFTTMNCMDCEANGECVTASWTAAFQKALQQSISFPTSDAASQKSNEEKVTLAIEPDKAPSMETNEIHNNAREEPENSKDSNPVGRPCQSCGMVKFALFPTSNGLLVCKKCKPKRRR